MQGNKQSPPRKYQDRQCLGAKIITQELFLRAYCVLGPAQGPEDVEANEAEALLLYAQSCRKNI